MLQILRFAGSSTFQRLVQFFSLVVFVVAGVVYCYQLNEAIHFSLSFPGGSILEASVWMIHISLQFVSLWMPCIVILSKFYMHNRTVLCIYTAGCILAIILSIVSTVLNTKYFEPGSVRDEYEKLVKTSIITSNNGLSSAVLYNVDSEEAKCCGWKGAIDFGVTFDISDKVRHDYKFMKELEICYGHTWTVSDQNGVLQYNMGPESLDQIPKGCNKFYKQLFQRNCLIVFYFGLLVDVFGVIFIILCWTMYKSTKTVNSGALQHEGVTPLQSVSDTDEFNPEFGIYYKLPATTSSTPINTTDPEDEGHTRA